MSANRAARRSAASGITYTRQLEHENARLAGENADLKQFLRASAMFDAITAGRAGDPPRITWQGVGVELSAAWSMNGTELAAFERKVRAEAADAMRGQLEAHLPAFVNASMKIAYALATAMHVAWLSRLHPAAARAAAAGLSEQLGGAAIEVDIAVKNFSGGGMPDDLRAGLVAILDGVEQLRTMRDNGEQLRAVWDELGTDAVRQMIGQLAAQGRSGQQQQLHTAYFREQYARVGHLPGRSTRWQRAQAVIALAREQAGDDERARALLEHWAYLQTDQRRQRWAYETLRAARH